MYTCIKYVPTNNSWRRASKLLNLRLFEDPATGKGWDKSVKDLGLEILCVSQV